MRALLRAELVKQRSTRTGLGLLAAMLGLVLMAVLLHSLLPVKDLGGIQPQLMVFGRGEFLGVLFAALLGERSRSPPRSATGRSGRPSSSARGAAEWSQRRSR